jgi:hypothetical protein
MTGRGCHVVDAMLYLAGHIESVFAQSYRLTLDYGLDDTTSMLFRFKSGTTGYLGTFIATAECWRMQVFGSKGWVKVGSIPHLHTWSLTTCMVNGQPTVIDYPQQSTERAELAAFADAIERGVPCQRPPHIEPPGSGKLSHPGSPIVSQAGSPILSHPGSAIGSHPVERDRIPSSFSPSPEILAGAHQLQEVTSGGTEESGDRHP